MRTPHSIILTALLVLTGCELLGDTSLPDYGEIEDPSYVRHVEVLFEDRCIQCHGQAAALPDLRSWEGMLRGGAAGGVVVPFEVSRSKLIRVLGTGHPADAGGDTLSTEETDFLRRWIAAGARHDDGRIPYADAEHRVAVVIPDQAVVAVVAVDYGAIARVVDLERLGFGSSTNPRDAAVAGTTGDWFVSVPGEGAVMRFDATLALTGLAEVPFPGQVAVSPDGAWVAVGTGSGGVEGRIHLIETRDMRVRPVDSVFPGTRAVAVRAGGDIAYAASFSADQLLVVPVSPGAASYMAFSGPRHGVIRLRTSADGTRLAAFGGASGEVVIVETTAPASPRQTGTLGTGSQLIDGALSQEGGVIAVDAQGGVWYRDSLESGAAALLTSVPGATTVTEVGGHVVLGGAALNVEWPYPAGPQAGLVTIRDPAGGLRLVEVDGVPVALTRLSGAAPTR